MSAIRRFSLMGTMADSSRWLTTQPGSSSLAGDLGPLPREPVRGTIPNRFPPRFHRCSPSNPRRSPRTVGHPLDRAHDHKSGSSLMNGATRLSHRFWPDSAFSRSRPPEMSGAFEEIDAAPKCRLEVRRFDGDGKFRHGHPFEEPVAEFRVVGPKPVHPLRPLELPPERVGRLLQVPGYVGRPLFSCGRRCRGSDR